MDRLVTLAACHAKKTAPLTDIICQSGDDPDRRLRSLKHERTLKHRRRLNSNSSSDSGLKNEKFTCEISEWKIGLNEYYKEMRRMKDDILS